MRRPLWLDPSVYAGDLNPDRLDQFEPELVKSVVPAIGVTMARSTRSNAFRSELLPQPLTPDTSTCR